MCDDVSSVVVQGIVLSQLQDPQFDPEFQLLFVQRFACCAGGWTGYAKFPLGVNKCVSNHGVSKSTSMLIWLFTQAYLLIFLEWLLQC